MALPTGIPHAHLSRRKFLGGIGAAAAVGTATTLGVAKPAAAASAATGLNARPKLFTSKAAPKPIEALVPAGGPAPFDNIHWLLPGPEGATTQILELGAFGLDADPSTIGDFSGFTAYAVIAGSAKDTTGTEYDVEFDVRVMQGKYIGEDGEEYRGTFGFF